jgi:hypothetical protein
VHFGQKQLSPAIGCRGSQRNQHPPYALHAVHLERMGSISFCLLLGLQDQGPNAMPGLVESILEFLQDLSAATHEFRDLARIGCHGRFKVDPESHQIHGDQPHSMREVAHPVPPSA